METLMNAQEIYAKRIEEAAHQYIQSDAVAPENMKLAFGDFINGARWTLQNQWISVEEALPTENRILAKLSPSFCGSEDYLEILHRIPIEMVDLKHPLGYYDSCGENVPTNAITHWAPIPSLEGGGE